MIEITKQKDLDNLPLDLDDRICIKFGTPDNRAVVSKRFKYPVEAWENSSVEAWENSQVVDRQQNGTINTNANARIVYDPKTIDEYINSIGDLEQTETSLKLYKAVHKRGGHYFSDNDNNFEYVIGQSATADGLTEEQTEDCGHGIHMADKSWCVAYGQDWNDLAILEVEAEKKDIVVPFLRLR